MSDIQLLKDAAKAAGWLVLGKTAKMVCSQKYLEKGGLCIRNGEGFDLFWNPLTDDGDALRLAVKLNINVYVREAYPYSEKEDGYPIELGCLISEKEEPDTYAATRRAIVRAAAEIGKTK